MADGPPHHAPADEAGVVSWAQVAGTRRPSGAEPMSSYGVAPSFGSARPAPASCGGGIVVVEGAVLDVGVAVVGATSAVVGGEVTFGGGGEVDAVDVVGLVVVATVTTVVSGASSTRSGATDAPPVCPASPRTPAGLVVKRRRPRLGGPCR